MEEEALHSYCTNCNSQVELTEECNYRITTPDVGGMHFPPEDRPLNIEVYLLLRCPKCSSPFTFLRQYNEIPAEHITESAEPQQLYPNTSEIPLENVPHTIKKAYEDAFQAYKVGLYAPSVLMCRKTLEAICFEKGVTTGNLEKKLSELKEKEIIDGNIYEWADSLRLIGNEAAHELLPNISKQDCRDTIDFTESVILMTFVLSNKFEEFKERRENSLKKNN